MTTLAELRKNRSSLMEKVNKAMAGTNNDNDRQKDDRFWTPTRDADTGVGSAIIRFLPPMKGDELPWTKIYSRAFKNEANGKWYINDDLSTIGQTDPVYEYIKPLYESGREDDKKRASTMKRKTHFISNVLIIKDPANPSMDGTVKLFKYGKTIHDMITARAQPEFEDITPCYVYDIDEGANFRLRIKKKDGYPNYDDSAFDAPTPLCGGDDDKIEKIIEAYVPLAEFTSPSKFKTYDQLKKDLDRVLGNTAPVGRASDLLNEDESSKPAAKKEAEAPSIPKKAEKVVEEKKEASIKKEEAAPWDSGNDDDDDIAMFKDLLK